MQQKYELMLLFKPLLVEDVKTKLFPRIEAEIKKNQGKVKKIDIWGKRLLAYPIGKYKEGNYVVSRVEMDPVATPKFLRFLKLNDSVLRFILLREEEL